MNIEVKKYLAAIGRKGGKAKSRAKTAAVRRNAKLGGWPKGKKRGKARNKPTTTTITTNDTKAAPVARSRAPADKQLSRELFV